MKQFADLPFASTLCGSCTNVCPVKIDIHVQLYKWRQVLAEEGYVATQKKLGIGAMNVVLSNPTLFKAAGKIGRWCLRHAGFLFRHRWNPWYKQREMPPAPAVSFNQWYRKNKKAR
jgi:L-lactate dehydrogenase complex protein LldF